MVGAIIHKRQAPLPRFLYRSHPPESCPELPRAIGLSRPLEHNNAYTSSRERVIAVFGHGDFFHTFLRLHMGVRGRWMENCDVVEGRLLA